MTYLVSKEVKFFKIAEDVQAKEKFERIKNKYARVYDKKREKKVELSREAEDKLANFVVTF